MTELIWKQSYNTGIHEIDIQHRQLLDYVNQLDTARKLNSRTKVKNVIEGMADYTLSHFAFEEALMEQANYPFTGPHRHIHKTLIARVVTFSERFKAGEDIADEFHALLRRWLINHIQRDDAAYVKPVRAHLRAIEQEKASSMEKKDPSSWLSRVAKKFFGG
ncbi:bacteriohemerythrin [Desulforhopalus sp. IMCC35007]|uniref:bacteriohemerythrin n=1 Tax=Desulforhopalus sp. IMCC35007 TaxID=2569543 RepID=UPI0010ADE75A|nr:bacteriohemerythrin [Desulforhopalus sp. IMCC35007]TKB10670.1 bacteriohemerythrin [Desulforhopalus sp. IMCC35007]